MAVEVIKLKRVFKFKDQELVDVIPEHTPKQIMQYYANEYPELNNGYVAGPTIENDKEVYEFKTIFGEKG